MHQLDGIQQKSFDVAQDMYQIYHPVPSQTRKRSELKIVIFFSSVTLLLKARAPLSKLVC